MAKKSRAREVKREDKSIEYLESRYMYESRKSIYIANEEINQTWDRSDIPEFIEMWERGIPCHEIQEYFGMDEWEYKLFLIDLLQKKRIKGGLSVVRFKT